MCVCVQSAGDAADNQSNIQQDAVQLVHTQRSASLAEGASGQLAGLLWQRMGLHSESIQLRSALDV